MHAKRDPGEPPQPSTLEFQLLAPVVGRIDCCLGLTCGSNRQHVEQSHTRSCYHFIHHVTGVDSKSSKLAVHELILCVP